MIAVKEFISNMEQGYTEAFLCRASDDQLYVVKSRKSGREALIREWMCARIGQELGVPVPPFEMVYATDSTAIYSGNEQMPALAEMSGFGSRFVTAGGGATPHGLPTLN